MLGGHAELLLVILVAVLLHQHLVLMVELPCVKQKFGTVVGQRNAPAAPVEYADTQFLFQLLHGAGQGRLGDIQDLGGLVQRSYLSDGNGVMKLL